MRLCGYCRLPGHTKNDCDVRKAQIDLVRKNVALSRKRAHDLLIANGVGVGSIVLARDYWSGREMECIVPSLESVNEQQIVDYKIIKYSKKARATVEVIGAEYADPTKESDLVRFRWRTRLAIPTYCLADMSKTVTAYFFVASFENNPFGKVPGKENGVGWYGERHSQVLAESTETDMTDDKFLAPVYLHERLLAKATEKSGLRVW